jgi:gas vesicle protein
MRQRKDPGSKNNLQGDTIMSGNDEDKSVLVSVLAGIGIGVLVGAIAGLLLAPKSGQETREDLSRSMGDLSDKVSELGRTVSQKVTNAVERTRAQVVQKLGEGSTDGEDAAG